MLNSFFPLDGTATEAQLKADLAAIPAATAGNEDLVAGESLGRTIGAAIVTRATGDNYLLLTPSATPVGDAGRDIGRAAAALALAGSLQ